MRAGSLAAVTVVAAVLGGGAALGIGKGAGWVGQRNQVDLLLLDGEPPGIQPREVEQIGGELRQARDLFAHRRHELALGRWIEVLVGQQLEEAAQREQRRPELV